MSQPPRTKHPLDVLQSMSNAILIETGKALRSSNKEGGKTLANAKTRLSSTIPSTIENFHLALDEMECDILRAKSVLLRDLEGLRAKRLALENPVPIVEEVEPIPELDLDLNGEATMTDAAEESTIKEEATQPESPEKQTSDETGFLSTQDPAKEDIVKIAEDLKDQHALTPPSNDKTSQPIGLGINTEAVANSPGPGTAEPQDSIDLLFDMPDNENTGDSELNFEHMDYSLPDSNQDPSQAQTHAFDLSTFGTASQDFNMNTMQTDSNMASNTNNENKEGEALFGMGNGGDNMDLDLDNLGFGTAGGEDSLFEDMFVVGDDNGFDGSGEMDHGDFDSAFFLIND